MGAIHGGMFWHLHSQKPCLRLRPPAGVVLGTCTIGDPAVCQIVGDLSSNMEGLLQMRLYRHVWIYVYNLSYESYILYIYICKKYRCVHRHDVDMALCVSVYALAQHKCLGPSVWMYKQPLSSLCLLNMHSYWSWDSGAIGIRTLLVS